MMGNDKIEPKPEPALLTNILDEVCETKIDYGNLSSPIVAIQNEEDGKDNFKVHFTTRNQTGSTQQKKSENCI